jgi:hypothetical protein
MAKYSHKAISKAKVQHFTLPVHDFGQNVNERQQQKAKAAS